MARFATIFISFFFFLQQVYAYSLNGGSISYKHLGGTKYLLTAKIYRDCRSGPIKPGDISFGAYGGNNGGIGCGAYSISGFTRSSIKELTVLCPKDTLACDPENTAASGHGQEEHVYEATVDLTASPLNNFYNKSTCCEITFFVSLSGRAPNTISSACSGGCAFFITATMNQCNLNKCRINSNSSPYLHNRPLFTTYCNISTLHSDGYQDIDDADSLKFSLVPALVNLPNSSISYSSPFTHRYFVTPYCIPSGSVTCTPNAKTNPIRGLLFDSTTGDVQFTGTYCSEVPVYVVQVSEYRKDTSGKWIFIGNSSRDVTFYVENLSVYNKNPVVTGPQMNKVCAGDKICFDIYGKDETFSPFQSVPDTVKMEWDSAIPAATFTIKNPTDREKTAQFCWQTHDSDAREPSYRFSVSASDEHCGLPMRSSLTFMVQVQKKAGGNMITTKAPCGSVFLEAKPASGFSGTPIAEWSIKNLSGKVHFTGKGLTDTARYLPKDKYIITLKLNNSNHCPIMLYDTIDMPELPFVSLGSDTFSCLGSGITLSPKTLQFATAPYRYQWRTTTLANTTDSLPYFSLKNTIQDSTLYLTVTDINGCQCHDTISVLLKPLPQVNIGADKHICAYQSQVFEAQTSDSVTYQWNTGETTKTIEKKIAGEYIVRVLDTTWKCENYDTVNLVVNAHVLAKAVSDTTICNLQQTTISASHQSALLPAVYRWTNLSTMTVLGGNKSYLVAPKNTNPNGGAPMQTSYEIVVMITENGLTCEDKDTISVRINSLPVVAWQKSPLDGICHNQCSLLLDPFVLYPPTNQRKADNYRIYSSSDKNTSGFVDSIDYDEHWLQFCNLSNAQLSGGKHAENELILWFRDSNGCINTASNKQRIAPNPIIALDTSYYCQNKGWAKLDSSIYRPKTKFGIQYSWKALETPKGISPAEVISCSDPSGHDCELVFGDPDEDQYAGKYKLELTVTDVLTGCESMDTTLVIVVAEPVLESSDPPPFCAGRGDHDLLGIFLSNGTSPQAGKCKFKIAAFNGDTSNGAFDNARIANGHYLSGNAKTGTWTISCNDYGNGCETTKNFDMVVAASPKAAFTTSPKDSAIVSLPVFQTTNYSSLDSNGILTYLWYFRYPSTVYTSTLAEPQITYPALDSSYQVRLVALGDNGCSDTSDHRLYIYSPTNNARNFVAKQIFIDEGFRVSGVEFQRLETSIFNASGKLIVTRNDNAKITLPDGIYFYRITLYFNPDKPLVFTGKKVTVN